MAPSLPGCAVQATEPAPVNGVAHSANGAAPALDGKGKPYRQAAASLERQIAAVDYGNGDGVSRCGVGWGAGLPRWRIGVLCIMKGGQEGPVLATICWAARGDCLLL